MIRTILCLLLVLSCQQALAQATLRLEGDEIPRGPRRAAERALAGLELPPAPRDAFDQRRAATLVRRALEGTFATQGFFTPRIAVEDDGGTLVAAVDPGLRTRIVEVDIEFRGPLATDADLRERREALLADWGLPVDEPFRQEDWTDAKRTLINAVLAEEFATASLVESEAGIEAETGEARLRVVIDSGPRFRFGELRIEGLERYDRRLVERYSGIRAGEPYSAAKVLDLQVALQATPYFGSVLVEADREAADPQAMPVRVRLTEAIPKRATVAAGFSSDTGARVETTFRHQDFLGRAWTAEAGLRLEQKRQAAFGTLRLPPTTRGWNDSLALLGENSDIAGLALRRVEAAAVRARTRGALESRYTLGLQRESRQAEQETQATYTSALTANASWTLRELDSLTDPRSGWLVNVQVGGGTKRLYSDQDFLRTLVRVQRLMPINARDSLQFRAQFGRTFAPSREGIPQTFLFRTGGSLTVRGYGFERLGVVDDGAVLGGRWLAVAGAEWQRWFTERVGGALFADVGDAADTRGALRPAVGVGAGLRLRSPVGPVAVDVARGLDADRGGRWRLHFAISLAF